MDPHGRGEADQQGRVKRLYDRLAKILKGMSPERVEALEDHLDAQEEREKQKEAEDAGPKRTTPTDDPG